MGEDKKVRVWCQAKGGAFENALEREELLEREWKKREKVTKKIDVIFFFDDANYHHE